jgi:TonB-dependent receptor
MNPKQSPLTHPRWFAPLRVLAALLFALASATTLPAQGTGRLAGTVRNSDTGLTLQGASVAVTTTNLQALTDEVGGFAIRDIPPGEYVVMIAYTGVDTVYKSVRVTSGAEARLDVEMSSQIYKMEAFTVTGEREGNAAAIVRQKTADNIKNVVSMDAFGQLPNDNAGELLIRLPGVAGVTDDSGEIFTVTVRGIAGGLNSVSINGNTQPSTGGMSREYRIGALTGAIFEELEVVKAVTPDMGADSLGGAINFKTRSALKMKRNHQFEYRLGARWAPPFLDQTPLRRDWNLNAVTNLQYMGVFGVFGGKRNLGVSLSAFYNKNYNGAYSTYQDYAYTTADPAYLWDYRIQNGAANGTQKTFSLNVDYNLSKNTRIFIRGYYNDNFITDQRDYYMRAYTRLNAAGVPYAPDSIGYYDDKTTEIRASAESRFALNSTRYSFLTRERQVQAGAEHTLGRLKVDYDLYWNRNHANLGDGMRDRRGGIFTMQMSGVGWIVDKTQSEEHPSFQQTTGPSIYDPDNYYQWLFITTREGSKRNSDVYGGSFNAKYALHTKFPALIKTGYHQRKHEVEQIQNNTRWYRKSSATNPLPIEPERGLTVEGAENLPFYDPAVIRRLQEENANFTATSATAQQGEWYIEPIATNQANYGLTRSVTEEIKAGYVMGQTRIGRLGILAGVRYERTGVRGVGWVDPDGDNNYEEHGQTVLTSNYDDFFPSAHLTCKLTPNLLARVSWSNTIGRPDFTNFVPNINVDDENLYVRMNNSDLKPQHSQNWDVSLEYYFEPVGQLTIGAFHKTLKDFIVTANIGPIGSGPDNGFFGMYDGYTLFSSFNGGKAAIKGVELNWQQQFTFLPGFLRGFGALANGTILTTSGDYGSTGQNNPVTKLARFVPETANAGLTYRYGRLSTRVMANYTGAYLYTYAENLSRLNYRDERVTVNVNASWRVRSELSFTVDVTNLFNAPQRYYVYTDSRLNRAIYSGTVIYFSISGRF